MELFGIAITLLTGVLTYFAWTNGRWMKQSHQDVVALLERMEAGQNESRKAMAEVRQDMAEARKEAAESRKEVAEAMESARKEAAEANKFLGQLIVSESEKTRQVVREITT